jgi:proteasome lid subunit RPN8/RPN11
MKKPVAAKKNQSPTQAQGQPPVEIAADVLQRIRRHARSSMEAEICGVLIGSIEHGATIIANTIEGQGARQAGTHVTFTQETWAHVYEVKDSQYPDDRIVGWYHSHPGFGVFLSEHDIFIHKNFFSDPNQVAWVFDPHSDEEGCFVWQDGEIVRLQKLEVKNLGSHSVESPNPQARESKDVRESNDAKDPDPSSPTPKPRRMLGRIVKWSVLTLSHLLLLVLGFLVAELFFPAVIYVRVPEKMDQQLAQPAQPASPQAEPAPATGKEKTK